MNVNADGHCLNLRYSIYDNVMDLFSHLGPNRDGCRSKASYSVGRFR